eukprot:TRINITY_DN848_c0_g1_i1.p1 TRINITY_DN848_c0_g1~~TRINITY_DN848_c0_g1_i1.p1  ORF type:complete len:652 (+),score=224.32 TRINITY_DN848_c0_g1_i1:23-1957(+)
MDFNSTSCFSFHNIIVTESGDLYVFGCNSFGQLGLPSDIKIQNKPHKLLQNKNIKSIHVGSNHSFFLEKNGDLYGTGQNNFGQLGNGDTKHLYGFVKVAENIYNVACSSEFTIYQKLDGEVYFSGRGLGFKSKTHEHLDIKNVISFSCGLRYAIFVDHQKKLYGLGCNKNGELLNLLKPRNYEKYYESIVGEFPPKNRTTMILEGEDDGDNSVGSEVDDEDDDLSGEEKVGNGFQKSKKEDVSLSENEDDKSSSDLPVINRQKMANLENEEENGEGNEKDEKKKTEMEDDEDDEESKMDLNDEEDEKDVDEGDEEKDMNKDGDQEVIKAIKAIKGEEDDGDDSGDEDDFHRKKKNGVEDDDLHYFDEEEEGPFGQTRPTKKDDFECFDSQSSEEEYFTATVFRQFDDARVVVCGTTKSFFLGGNDFEVSSKKKKKLDQLRGLVAKDVQSIHLSGDHVMALMKNGDVMAYGLNKNSQLGLLDSSTKELESFKKVASNIRKISVGYNFSMLISFSGEVLVYGYNRLGQLGQGDLKPRYEEKDPIVCMLNFENIAITQNSICEVDCQDWSPNYYKFFSENYKNSVYFFLLSLKGFYSAHKTTPKLPKVIFKKILDSMRLISSESFANDNKEKKNDTKNDKKKRKRYN